MLIERTATGGQAGQSSRIENYLGFPDGVSGCQLADRARRQAEKFGAELITAARRCDLEINGKARTLRLVRRPSIGARAVILATGVSIPATAGRRLRRADRRGRLLRRDCVGRRGLRRRGGLRHRRRQLGRTGGDVPVA